MLEDRNDQALSGWDFYTTAFQSGLLPDPALWVDEWADRHMVIPPNWAVRNLAVIDSAGRHLPRMSCGH